MPKFTWITIFLSVFITIVVTEVVINEYKTNKPINKGTELLQAKENPTDTNLIPDTKPNTGTKIEDTTDANKPLIIDSKITETILSSLKITNPLIKKQAYNGQILDLISLELSPEYVNLLNLFSGQEFIGSSYEIHFKTPLDAEENYAKLKNDAIKIDSLTINENNSFGEKSFYINQDSKQNSVLVITKIGTSIYGFKYPHTSHSKFKSLTKYL